MKISRLPGLLLLMAFLLALAAPRVRAQEEVSFDYFYDNLKPYGDWVQVADYGLCWHPRDVDEDWAPYTDGYWAYTDAGWTWVSYEEFGDIVYHYGRWVRVEDEGWCWVPDNDWGPAWVSWRNNDDYVGWAPLPPEARFEPAVGISVWADDTYDIGPGYYRFCHVRDFGAPVIREVCLPRSRNVGFFRDTVNITNITINSGYGTPFCGGPRYDFVSRRVSRPIPALKLVRETNITNIINVRNVTNINVNGGRRGSAFASVQRGNSLLMPAPRIRPREDRTAPVPNLNPARVLAANRVNRGWGDVRTPGDRDEIRQAIRQQNKGATPQTAPARAFTPAEVKVVPQKSDLDGPSPVSGGRSRPPLKGRNPVVGLPPADGARTPSGRGPTAATEPNDEAPVPRVPKPGATPLIGKGPKGRAPTVVAPVVPADPTRPNVDEPVARVPQPPVVGRSGKVPVVRTPVTPGEGIRSTEPPRSQPDDSPRVLPEKPQRVGPGAGPRVLPGNVPAQPFRGSGEPVIPRAPLKGGAANNPTRVIPKSPEISNDDRPEKAEAAREQAMRQQQMKQQQQQAEAQREQSQRQQQQAAAARQQQASVAAQERNAALAEARQRSAAAEDARERASAGAARQQAAAAQARQRAIEAPPIQRSAPVAPQRIAPTLPPRPTAPAVVPGAPTQDPRTRGKGKDKDDDRR